jgi:hypothetical protein
MNYCAFPGKWPYPNQNGDFCISGDEDHWGIVTAYTRSGGSYVHPLRRYLGAKHTVNFGSFSFFKDTTRKPWNQYIRVPVPSGATATSLIANSARKQ